MQGAGGIELWWDREGAGAPILLVPGRGDSSDVFARSFRARLAAGGCAVLRYDPRDAGLSGDAGPDTTLRDLADDAVAVLDAAGVERAHLVGLSLGGLLLVDLATRCPERVEGLVFLAAMSPDPDAGFGVHFFGDPAVTPLEAVLRVVGPVSPEDRALLTAELDHAEARAPSRPEAGARHEEAAFRSVWPDLVSLGAIAAPALVIHGDSDTVLPLAHAEAYASNLSDARLVVMPGMGHLPRPADWDRIADHILDHVGLPGPGRGAVVAP